MAEEHAALTVIPDAEVDPKTMSILSPMHRSEQTVLFRGEGRTTPVWDCGSCSSPLLVGISRGQIVNVVLQCPKCLAYNLSPG